MANPQYTNSINNTELNQLNITPSFSQTAQTQALNVFPTFTQASGGPYYAQSITPAFNFTGTAAATVANTYGSYVAPTFTPTSSSGIVTLTNTFGGYFLPTATASASGVITNLYSLYADTPTGATNNYTAVLGSATTAKVGIGIATPTQGLTVNTGASFKVTTTATSYTALITDFIIEVTSTSAARTITLPAPSTTGATRNVGQVFWIKDASGGASTNNITITPASGTIDGASNLVIASAYGFAIVYSDGTNYYSISEQLSPFFTWNAITAAQTLVPSNGYLVTGTASVSLALPSTAPIGSVIEVTNTGTFPWVITQAAGQSIRMGNVTTTTGTGGSLTGNNQGDSVKLVSTVAGSTTWQVVSSIGNILVT